jgi:DNA-binding NarL/FixJ family response regulator
VLDSNIDPLVHTSFLNAYAHALVNATRYEEALATAQRQDIVANEHGLEFAHRFAAMNEVRAMIGLRRFPLAERSLSRMRRVLALTPDDYQVTQIAIQTASLYLSLGDPTRAYAALTGPPLNRLGKAINGERLATRALACASLGDRSGALEDAKGALSKSRLLEVRALSNTATAIAALASGDTVGATAAVREALDAETPHAVVLGLRAHPPLTEPVLEVSGRERLSALLSSSKDAGLARRAGVQVPRSKLRSESLSPRELEIHGLLAQGLTNQEIAKLLFISQSTTKVHVRHILEKLGVRSRVEAVRIWEEPPGA